jgi:hypothetical protein
MVSLVGIARAPSRRAALEEISYVEIGLKTGLAGDARGRTPGRQVTVLFREGWDAACRDIGSVVLEVTEEATPCRVMEAAQRGLEKALTPEWRGGVCCRVKTAGSISIGDPVRLVT